MIHNNERYMNVPHGPSNKSTSVLLESKNGGIDRNKVYSQRSGNPIIIPSRVTEIPAQLAMNYDTMNDNEIIFEGELMKYKPGLNHMYMSRWC